MDLAGCRFDASRRGIQEIMRTMHATFGRRLLVLLNGHDGSPMKNLIDDYSKPRGKAKLPTDLLAGFGMLVSKLVSLKLGKYCKWSGSIE